MALISRSHSFAAILVLYFITGMGSGAANVPVMGLITAWFDRTVRGQGCRVRGHRERFRDHPVGQAHPGCEQADRA